jgi:hypothetical protein
MLERVLTLGRDMCPDPDRPRVGSGRETPEVTLVVLSVDFAEGWFGKVSADSWATAEL